MQIIKFTDKKICSMQSETENADEIIMRRCSTCISGSIASPNEKAITPRALKALKILEEVLPCNV